MNQASPVIDRPRPSVAGGPVRLLLGGRTTRIPGFTNIDLFEGENVDIKTDASNLSMFGDGEVDEIYASHILEHFSHKRTVAVLKEWARVLRRGGVASISVPDFDPLVKLYAKGGFVPYIRNMLYGDQIYDLAFHYTIFTFPVLAAACAEAGFSDVQRIQSMPYGIIDCSTNRDTCFNLPVSVSVRCVK